MKKQTKVLLAAAALTLGASFTAMAAETYDWKMEDGQWVCYDEDGDVYDNEWVDGSTAPWWNPTASLAEYPSLRNFWNLLA